MDNKLHDLHVLHYNEFLHALEEQFALEDDLIKHARNEYYYGTPYYTLGYEQY